MDYRRTGIPHRFWNVTLDEYVVEAGLEEAHAATVEYLDKLKERREDGVGLLYVGPPSWGKTMLVCTVLGEALRQGFDARFTMYAGYVKQLLTQMDLKSAWQKHDDVDSWNDWVKLSEWLVTLRNKADFLGLDDIGKEHSTNTRFAEDEFDFLIRHRFDLGLPTLLTSNVPISDWAGRYTDSMQSFVAEAFVIVRVGGEGEDYRWRRH